MKYLLLALVYVTPIIAHSQSKTSAGLAGTYNAALQTFGIGIRAQFSLNQKFYISPQMKYIPPIKDFHEVTMGINTHYYLIKPSTPLGNRYQHRNLIALYLIGGVHYNRWINYAPTINPKAKQNNILPEVGAGLELGRNYFKIFTEANHNTVWMEPSFEIGMQINLSKRSKPKCFFPL
ncbi:hypothetical protein Lbys_2426 [Leadbetterella byssophila DSM 17132]|uniref:Outer membrane protein beta-barrel domain-containing protein n=1 Tax=Leadbetterella byssophila (strain DSM 17132 / JCM 16389 / KACC 11308 / NBRC 106382 / 4M15) TaxID=649349 RepID=E4RXN0_LEAB4|nr:hypothetical protein [Leadbetterella byssophila]ADQ18094.1 hypothetical protein Lbys_2426 [Leadbetterella byssophila DSM 17132]